jgi:spermidine synthase
MKTANLASSSDAIGSALGSRTALVLCGFTAVVGQIVLMRELIQVFNGNEIVLGILLATWLLGTAVGSALASATGLGRVKPRLTTAVFECLLAASLPATIWALRSVKAFFQTVPGELVGTVPMLVTSLECLSLFCVTSGALFVAAAGMAETERELSARAAASTAYLLEAAGSAMGGILASVVLVRWCDAFQIAVFAGLLNLCLAVSLLLRLRRAQVAVLTGVALISFLPLLLSLAPRWDAGTREQLWRGFHVVGARESIYGNLVVTETGDNEPGTIRSLYENGEILANAPDPAAAEEGVHYALLEHPAPRRVLLISGGLNGAVFEVLKHPTVVSLDYAELDPTLIEMAREYFPAQTAGFDSDSRVHLQLVDGRRYLSETRKRFDVVIIAVPDPQTAQLNRFYTAEFFQLVRAHLGPGGLVAIQFRSSEEAISPDLAAFLRSIRRTLSDVFPYQAVIPGETIHFFGALDPGTLTSDPQVLIARLRERKLATQYVREYFIPYRMTPDRMQQVEIDLTPSATTPVNRDFTPIAYAFDVVLWSAQFKSRYAEWFRWTEHIDFRRVASAAIFALLAGIAVLVFLPGSDRRERAAAGVCVAATGFTLMALQIFLLLGFQAVYGYVYAELSVLIGLFMAGMGLGAWLAMYPSATSTVWRLATVQLLVVLAAPMTLLVVTLAGQFSSGTGTWIAAQIAFPAMATVSGLLGGYQFAVAAGVFLRKQAGLGVLYAIDLLGGCVGALALTTFLIPIFGFWRTAWLALIVNGAAVLHAAKTGFTRCAAGR